MKACHWIIAAAVLASVAPAQAGINDPEVIIYRFPGVRDSGDANFVGVATVFHCTNFSGVQENIRLVTRNNIGGLAANFVVLTPHLSTVTLSTHFVVAYANQSNMQTGLIAQGTTAIAATSINVICTAETIDASILVPAGVARRGIRFSPVPGSQE